VNDVAGFVIDAETTQAADDFLSVAEALADPTATRITDDAWPRAPRNYLRPGNQVELIGTVYGRKGRPPAAPLLIVRMD
jgi:hypothetical protein